MAAAVTAFFARPWDSSLMSLKLIYIAGASLLVLGFWMTPLEEEAEVRPRVI